LLGRRRAEVIHSFSKHLLIVPEEGWEREEDVVRYLEKCGHQDNSLNMTSYLRCDGHGGEGGGESDNLRGPWLHWGDMCTESSVCRPWGHSPARCWGLKDPATQTNVT
jgi:hypothetical protein